MAETAYQAVEANRARITAAGADRWVDLLRETMPEGLVRDAIPASPAWPDMADKMAFLDRQGVDVAGFLRAAHGQGVGVDRAVAAVLTQQAAAPQVPAAAPAATAGVPAARPAPALPSAPWQKALPGAKSVRERAADGYRQPCVTLSGAVFQLFGMKVTM
ncbi:hypothetical protein [Streptomyces sp. NRRL F-2747]|uniref:hypothetical protein n=1 Tax=Streptomyces sp. NRRL F-2747 TaxID=1463843 RepID=UPI0004C769FB|nr:hypothetical protein [Streptomyces sp. NRRL F-2747]